MRQEQSNFITAPIHTETDIVGPVGIFVDGENVRPWTVAEILGIVGRGPLPRLCRVYGHNQTLHGWHSIPGFEIINTGVLGNGGVEFVKNTADVKITVDVMEFVHVDHGQTVILCSSDRDFTPLAWSLRKLGRTVIGMGDERTSEHYRSACTRFVVAEKCDKRSASAVLGSMPVSTDRKIVEWVVTAIGQSTGKAIALAELGQLMSRRFKVNKADLDDPDWRSFLKRHQQFIVDEDNMVRLVKKKPPAKGASEAAVVATSS